MRHTANPAEGVLGVFVGHQEEDAHPKLKAIQKAATKLKNQRTESVWQLAQLVEVMVAAHPAILQTPLHYKHPSKQKQELWEEV